MKDDIDRDFTACRALLRGCGRGLRRQRSTPATIDVVVTLCAEEACPVFVVDVRRLHSWPINDPVVGRSHRRAHLERLHHVSTTQVDARDPWGLAGVPR